MFTRFLSFSLLLLGLSAFGQAFTPMRPFIAPQSTDYPQLSILAGFFDTRSDSDTIRSNSIVTNWVNKISPINSATNTIAKGATWVASGGAGGYGYLLFSKSSPATSLTWHPTNGAPDVAQQKTPITIAVLMRFDITNTVQSMADAYSGAGIAYPAFILAKSYSSFPNGIAAWDESPATEYVDSGILPSTNDYYRIIAVLGEPQQQIWTNGVLASTNAGNAAHTYSTNFNIGLGNMYGLNGRMHRFMLWRGALTSNECIQVDTMIKNDFGL